MLVMSLTVNPLHYLIVAPSQSIGLILFPNQWQILIKTMSLLWIYYPLYHLHLLMVSP